MVDLPSRWEGPLKLNPHLSNLFDALDQGMIGQPEYGRTDIYEKDSELHYEIELPGVTKEDITARVENDTLIVKGEIQRDETISRDNYLRMERKYGSFQKQYPLPEEVDTDNIEELKARFENGILKISLPLKESVKGDTIDIEIE